MRGQNKSNFIARWNACKAGARTHPYVQWIATVSHSTECKNLHGMSWSVDSEVFSELVALHISRKDDKCACRISPTSKLPSL